VKDVRIALEDNGHAKGFAFVEFEDPVRFSLLLMQLHLMAYIVLHVERCTECFSGQQPRAQKKEDSGNSR
jgi:hypothetical protein